MKTLLRGLALLLLTTSCGGGENLTPPPQQKPPRETLTPDAMKTRWQPLAVEETEVAQALEEMSRLTADARMQKLQRARDGAGFILSGLEGFAPPAEHTVCYEKAVAGAREMRAALDGIHELWLGRGAADRRTESIRLADRLCMGAGSLAAGRSACGITATLPRSSLCGP